jgi:hypothetical protein
MTHTHKRIARVFADVGGCYYSSGESLDTRGRAFPTIAACVRYLRDSNALRDIPFTHYVRGERVRPLWGKASR